MKTHASGIHAHWLFAVLSLWPLQRCDCEEIDTVSNVTSTIERLAEQYKETEAAGTAYDRAHPPSDNWGGYVTSACRIINTMGDIGGREALPFLEEKSLDPENPKSIRSAAARAYIKIADVGESVNLMRKLYGDRSFRESRYYYVSNLFLQKVKSEGKPLTDEVKRDICTHLLAIVQRADSPGDALDAEFFLRDFFPGYTNSKQRATLVRYANTGNEYMTNNFNPIKAHFDKIPPKQRIDLRKRFPDLPPLPEDVSAGDGDRVKAMIASVVGFAALAACAAAVWLVFRRRRSHGAG